MGGERRIFGLPQSKWVPGSDGLATKYLAWNPPKEEDKRERAGKVWLGRKGKHPERTKDDDWKEAEYRLERGVRRTIARELAGKKVRHPILRK